MVVRRITSTRSADFVPLGTEGQRSFDLITREAEALGPEHRALFAEPFVSPAGDSIDWYATVHGTAVALSRLEGADADAARAELARLTGDIEARAAELIGQTDPERRRLGEALRNSVVHPGDDSVFVIAGQPVLVCWAHQASRGSAPVAALTQTAARAPSPPPMPAAAPLAESAPPSSMAPAAAADRPSPLGWLWWLLWGLVGTAAVAIALLLVPACGLSLVPGLDFCEEERVAADEAEIDRRTALEAELRQLERELALADLACLPEPPPSPPEPEPERRAEAPQCEPGQERLEIAETLYLIDASSSMRIGFNAPAALERRLRRLGQSSSLLDKIEIPGLIRRLETQFGDSRIDVVKRVFDRALRRQTVGPTRVGAFGRCGSLDLSPVLGDADAVRRRIQAIRLDDATPLAYAIRRAASEVSHGGPGQGIANVILVSDGYDSCNGDPCAAARAARQQKPNMRIHVIDLSGVPELRCVSDATGGQYFERPEQLDLDFLEQTLSRAAGDGEGACTPVTTPREPERRTEAPSPEDTEIDRRVDEAGGESDTPLQITLVWDSRSDIDLRLVTPSGCEISYTAKNSCGGVLDVDRNAGASQVRDPVENIAFRGPPQSGTYRIFVKNFEKRGSGADAFRVRVQKPQGGQTFTGRLPRDNQVAQFTFRYP